VLPPSSRPLPQHTLWLGHRQRSMLSMPPVSRLSQQPSKPPGSTAVPAIPTATAAAAAVLGDEVGDLLSNDQAEAQAAYPYKALASLTATASVPKAAASTGPQAGAPSIRASQRNCKWMLGARLAGMLGFRSCLRIHFWVLARV
jgi:hypothetical protein